jgi:hypothetical protein
MAEKSKTSVILWTAAVLALIVAVAAIWCRGILLPPETNRIEVSISESHEKCAAIPHEAHIVSGGEVCFKNGFDRSITIKFDEPMFYGDQLVDSIVVPPKNIDPECVKHNTQSNTTKIEYTVVVDSEPCTDPMSRPKIIIDR